MLSLNTTKFAGNIQIILVVNRRYCLNLLAAQALLANYFKEFLQN